MRNSSAGGNAARHVSLENASTLSSHSLAEENALLHTVIDNFPGGILLYDRNLKLVLCNEAQKRLLDYPPALFEYGLPTLEQIFRFNAVRGEYGAGDVEAHVRDRMRLAALREPHHYRRTRPNGTVLEIRGVPLPGGGFLTTYLDITQRPGSQVIQEPAALSDPATELPNWPLFLDRFEQALARVRRGHVVALHYIDLDHFKQVEVRYGHHVSEALLRGIAMRIKGAVRGCDTVVRRNEDEFIVLQTEVDRPSSVARLSKRIIDAIKLPFAIANYSVAIDATIGVAMSPRDGVIVDDLVATAKAHLYRSRDESGEAEAVHACQNTIPQFNHS